MKALTTLTGLIAAALLISLSCNAQQNNDLDMAWKARRCLAKANALNGVTITLGLASNIEMLAIGGFPLEADYGQNVGYNLSHMCISLGRVVTSVFPASYVGKARRTLEPWRKNPEMATSCNRLFNTLDAAQVLSALAPVLCVTGGTMMFIASTSVHGREVYDPEGGWYYESITSKPGLKTAGWILVGTGLAASISSAVLIGISKHELDHKIGTFKLSAGITGIGVKYSLPVKN